MDGVMIMCGKSAHGVDRIVLFGDVTHANRAMIQDVIAWHCNGERDLEIDIMSVTRIDMEGILLLIAAKMRASNRRRNVRIVTDNGALMRVLDGIWKLVMPRDSGNVNTFMLH